MKRNSVIFSIIFSLVLLCLGFSFVGIKDQSLKAGAIDTSSAVEVLLNGNCVDKGGAIYLAGGSTYNMSGGTVSGHYAEKGGAIYIGDGATFTMSGGTISDCTATRGGAVYVANGGTFIYTGGMIENCSADFGCAVYVASGGVFNFEVNPEGFSGCGEEEGLHIYAEEGASIMGGARTINIYVDGALEKTMTASGNSYTIIESAMPLEFEDCCGYFYDEKLSRCTNGIVSLPFSNKEINIYTKTASDASNFTFTLNETTNTYDIKASSTSISGDIVLPKEYNNVQTSIYEVVDDEEGAFYGCSELTSITFQDGLLEISNYSFYALESLEGELIIPDSVTSIGDCAFEGCSGFTGDLTIPDSVTIIGELAFSDCYGFTGSLIIGNGVTSIGSSAFYWCSFTGDLIIPDSVIRIEEAAFDSCEGFTGNLIIGNNITSIGACAFYYCGFTGSLTIPDSVISIGEGAFAYANFNNVLVSENNSVYEDKDKNVIVEKNTKTIVQGFNCTDLNILEEATSIGNYAFDGCESLTGNLIIPDSITSIGEGAFSNCSGFTGNLVIPDGVTSIGNSAFSFCSGLTGSLIIPDSVTSIGHSAFYACSGLTGSLIIPDSVTSIGHSAFYACSGLTGSLVIPNGVTTISAYAFYNCSGLTGNLVIPDGLTSIGSVAFAGCTGLTSLIIPSSVISIDWSPFRGCTSLTSVYIPKSVTTIEATGYPHAPFYECSSSLVIYTDLANSYSRPSGWGVYWNCYSSSAQLTVNYGVSLEEYKAAVGLTFAPSNLNSNSYDIEYMAIESNNVAEAGLNVILNDRKEYVALLKENEKIA